MGTRKPKGGTGGAATFTPPGSILVWINGIPAS